MTGWTAWHRDSSGRRAGRARAEAAATAPPAAHRGVGARAGPGAAESRRGACADAAVPPAPTDSADRDDSRRGAVDASGDADAARCGLASGDGGQGSASGRCHHRADRGGREPSCASSFRSCVPNGCTCLAPACRSALRTPPSAELGADVTSRLQLPDRYVVSLATLEPRKGLDVLIAALAKLRDAAPSLLVVGQPGWGGVDLPSAARAAGLSADKVRLLGRLPDPELGVVLRQATLLAMPSRAEGFGLPVAEAMTVGTPVVCSADPALVEVAGDAAEIVPVGDASALAEAIEGLLQDDVRRHDLITRGLGPGATIRLGRGRPASMAAVPRTRWIGCWLGLRRILRPAALRGERGHDVAIGCPGAVPERGRDPSAGPRVDPQADPGNRRDHRPGHRRRLDRPHGRGGQVATA